MNDKRFIIIGIDPGKTGAIAVYDFNLRKVKAVFDMPVLNGRVNGEAVYNYISMEANSFSHAVIEAVHAMDSYGVVSAFSFGQTVCVVEGILQALRIKFAAIEPSVWKAHMGLSSNKAQSIEMARSLFPEIAGDLRLKKHDGRAEAALLAYFGFKFGVKR